MEREEQVIPLSIQIRLRDFSKNIAIHRVVVKRLQKVDFDRCTFMTSIKLKTFLEHAPLTDTTEVSFAGCSKIESIGFSYFAKQMTGRLVLLEMSECQHLKDE